MNNRWNLVTITIVLRMWLWLWLWLWLSLSLSVISVSAFPEYSLTVSCPSDRSLSGYISLLDLNTELRRHASAMAPPLNQIPSAEFRYHLCPQTTLDATNHSLLLPPALLLHAPIIQCGREGNSLDSCIIQGGDTQVLLMDDWSNSTQRRTIEFRGLTFQDSQDISIAAFSTRTTARFIDCHWANAQGRAAIMTAKARALSWPQVPQPTFALEEHNIFSSRRRLGDTATAATTTTDTSMEVFCQRCSFQNSGQDGFVLLDSYLPGATFSLEDSTIDSVSGAMVANMLYGRLQLSHTSVSRCSTTVATIRAQFQSTLELYNVTFQENIQAIATIAITENSKLLMNFTHLQQNVAGLAPMAILEKSHAVLADSCWTVMDSSRSAIIVDSTSSVVPERTTITVMEQDEIAEVSATACPASIWKLNSAWTCLTTDTCQGDCESILLQDQCLVAHRVPERGNTAASDATTRRIGTSLVLLFTIGSALFL